MAVETGYSKTITSGSVFLYDTGDTVNCYKGEPITNQFQVQGTSGLGAAADNAVNFPVQGTVGFVRLGFGQTFGGYTIQQNDVVYKYPFNAAIGGCHYHGNTASIPAGAYLTFTFDYYISPDTNFATGNSIFLANVENYGGGALGGGVNMPNYLKDVWQTVTFTVGPRGGGTGTQAMFLYPGGCGGNIATNGFILFRNPRVYWLPYDVPFVQGTRSTTQAMIDIVGGNTINLVNMTYGANNAISFDGTDDYISAGNSNFNITNQFTIEVLCNPTNIQPTGMFNLKGPSFDRGIMSHWPWVDGNGYFDIYNTAGTFHRWYANISSYINTFALYHFRVDSTGAMVVKRNTVTLSPISAANFSGTVNLGESNTIGAFHSNGGLPWAGQMPVFKIYNRGLTDNEISDNYNHYRTRFNLP